MGAKKRANRGPVRNVARLTDGVQRIKVPIKAIRKSIHAEGWLEADAARHWAFLAHARCVSNVTVQPFTLSLVVNGRKTRYTPDAEVVIRRRSVVVEVKPEAKLQCRWTLAKLQAAELALRRENKRFVVLTETHLCRQSHVEYIRRFLESDRDNSDMSADDLRLALQMLRSLRRWTGSWLSGH